MLHGAAFKACLSAGDSSLFSTYAGFAQSGNVAHRVDEMRLY
jgi:hypothetical protein